MNAHELPLSPTVVVGEWVVVSGQLGTRGGAIVSDGVGAQTRAALDNIGDLLARHDLALADLIKTTVFLTSMNGYDDMNTAYRQVLGGHLPARTTVAVLALPHPDALVEIEAWARLNPDTTPRQHGPTTLGHTSQTKDPT